MSSVGGRRPAAVSFVPQVRPSRRQSAVASALQRTASSSPPIHTSAFTNTRRTRATARGMISHARTRQTRPVSSGIITKDACDSLSTRSGWRWSAVLLFRCGSDEHISVLRRISSPGNGIAACRVADATGSIIQPFSRESRQKRKIIQPFHASFECQAKQRWKKGSARVIYRGRKCP